MWESKIPLHSISCYLLMLYWLMCLECSWIECKYIHVYASLNDGDTFWEMRL